MFDKKGKLRLCCIILLEILNKVDNAAYRLPLSPEFSIMHDVFHVSMIRKYLQDPYHVMNYQILNVPKYFSYEEVSIVILDRKV